MPGYLVADSSADVTEEVHEPTCSSRGASPCQVRWRCSDEQYLWAEDERTDDRESHDRGQDARADDRVVSDDQQSEGDEHRKHHGHPTPSKESVGRPPGDERADDTPGR